MSRSCFGTRVKLQERGRVTSLGKVSKSSRGKVLGQGNGAKVGIQDSSFEIGVGVRFGTRGPVEIWDRGRGSGFVTRVKALVLGLELGFDFKIRVRVEVEVGIWNQSRSLGFRSEVRAQISCFRIGTGVGFKDSGRVEFGTRNGGWC
ncbi:hypothetical protein TIFTF001_055876 [Ficus carica]|uniref:Uncharacterized protein n=1 Tax=Ficus carica TaxID=3494 RepID=A0AA88JBF9_FICCA|nr:hypothetical protein TIFTF001_055876 [Ficus carica]